jgi:hypothetical protein
MAPYSDGYMEDMEIDPCYEGVLMFLRNEMGNSSDCITVMKLRHELDETHDALCAACESVIAASNIISFFKDCKPCMQGVLIAIAKDMRDTTQEILNDAISRKEQLEVNSDNYETEAKAI